MLDGLFLAEDLPLPTSFAVGHHAKNDPGYFQPRLSQANCDPLCQENTCESQSHTVGNPLVTVGVVIDVTCLEVGQGNLGQHQIVARFYTHKMQSIRLTRSIVIINCL